MTLLDEEALLSRGDGRMHESLSAPSGQLGGLNLWCRLRGSACQIQESIARLTGCQRICVPCETTHDRAIEAWNEGGQEGGTAGGGAAAAEVREMVRVFHGLHSSGRQIPGPP